MIAEFQNHWEEEYKINLKTSDQLQSVIDKRNTRNEKNAQTQRDRNTTADMDETRADGVSSHSFSPPISLPLPPSLLPSHSL